MSSYKEELSSRESDSLDDVEMQERESDTRGEQEDRLLPSEDSEEAGELEYKVEWHLRTGWAIAFSILAAGLTLIGLVLFTKFFIVGKTAAVEEDLEVLESAGFRRPASDYILDPSWNMNAAPTVRKYKWTVMDIVANPDGVFRQMITINGKFPGPMIECNEGDSIIVDIDNQSVNATSIHFHGIYQNGTNHMDGTAGITQCPIAPRRKFQYRFTITGQSGTYYYHGHQAIQISDGLYGPLVIHSRNEKKLQHIPYATDRVVMLQDYYHDISSRLLVTNLEPGNESPPIPNGALINGLNKRDCSQLPERLCDNRTATIPAFDLTANAHHRLRFINAGAFAWFQVSVDQHEFAITEADGTDVVPTYDSRLMIAPAQRYSMIINTNQTDTDLFWLRARMVTHCWAEPDLPGPGADEVKAIIHYSKPKKSQQGLVSQPTSRAWSQGMEMQCRDMNTTLWEPASFEPAPSAADYSYYLRANLEIGDWRLQRGFFNTSTFRPNLRNPTLHRTVEGLASQNETFNAMRKFDGVNDKCYDKKNDFTIQHAGIKVVDLIIQNFDEGSHPMHLHGHKFWVLGQGHGMFPGYDTLGLKLEGKGTLENQEHALDRLIRRDVATPEGFGWLALRFVTDNPGIWAFHCHMAWHSEAGLLMQFVSRIDELAIWQIPEENQRLCDANIEELEKGAAPKDEQWFGFGIGG
ncbi:hypothetical protein IFR05_002277 [Cadophora sp. M221]|nr:hypothetical protein IFR05_002277 [Cadophora sp. M221]